MLCDNLLSGLTAVWDITAVRIECISEWEVELNLLSHYYCVVACFTPKLTLHTLSLSVVAYQKVTVTRESDVDKVLI
jgi:hypothetical protein